jgi:hypothetical protein
MHGGTDHGREIGAIIGISQMQISRIIRAALKRLRTVGASEAPPTNTHRGA